VLFLSVNFAICLINDIALAADTLGHPAYSWCLDYTLIVVDASYAVVVCIADVDFDVSPAFIVQ